MPDNMERFPTLSVRYPQSTAIDLCIHYLLLATAAFQDVPEVDTPDAMITRLNQISDDAWDAAPAAEWIRNMTAAYNEAADEAKAEADAAEKPARAE